MYEPTTVEIDRVCGKGNYRSYTIYFVGRLIEIVEAGHTTMRLYEWADRGRLLYLVHLEEEKPGRPPRSKGYTAEEVSRAYPEFAAGRFVGPTWNLAPTR